MVQKKGGKPKVFKIGQIVFLAIPKRMRQSTKPTRVPARVLEKTKQVISIYSFA